MRLPDCLPDLPSNGGTSHIPASTACMAPASCLLHPALMACKAGCRPHVPAYDAPLHTSDLATSAADACLPAATFLLHQARMACLLCRTRLAPFMCHSTEPHVALRPSAGTFCCIA